MPELPEVETTCRGIKPHILGKTITSTIVRNGRLRWPVQQEVQNALNNQKIKSVIRRAKYIIIELTNKQSLLIHLGMSGSLRITESTSLPKKHDHIDVNLENGKCIRFHDPRRFGCFLLVNSPWNQHPLIASLGPEPFDSKFDATYLYDLSKQRKSAVKNFIMDNKVVVGVGNIYASEALFRAGILPTRPAGKISFTRYEKLIISIKEVLEAAISQGGTTLRDFVNESGAPGYFQQTLNVYGRDGLPCRRCSTLIKATVIGQRNSFLCPKCQT